MIHSYKFSKENIKDVGVVTKVKGTLVIIEGFSDETLGEAISFETGEHGVVMSIFENSCEAMVLSKKPIDVGTKVARTGIPMSVSVGDGLLTHVVNPLGYVIDERRDESKSSENRAIDISPVGISGRSKIKKFLTTGIAIVDLMVPIGEGQRELIIGNRKSGKSFFILTTVITQAKMGKICVLALIGKNKAEVKKTEEILEREGVINKCVIVASTSEHSSGEVFLTPYTAMTIAEYFRDKGQDTLVILDDMTTHAKYYREMSLVAGRFPGRESYPGDIFHIQSQIIERAGNFKIGDREVSITCLPVAQTMEADLTGYIQTNLMGMTDGHIFFDSELFFRGIRPSVNIFLSVSRVGHQVQPKDLRELSQKAIKLLKQVENLERFLKFGPEVTDDVKSILSKGNAIWNFFRQDNFIPITPEMQIQKMKEILR